MATYRSTTTTSVHYHEADRFSKLVRKYAPNGHPEMTVRQVSIVKGERHSAQIDVKVLIDVDAGEDSEADVSDAAEETVTHALFSIKALPRDYSTTVEVVT